MPKPILRCLDCKNAGCVIGQAMSSDGLPKKTWRIQGVVSYSLKLWEKKKERDASMDGITVKSLL